jgi:hypothetical protein
MGAACPAIVLAADAVSKLPKSFWITTVLLALALLAGAVVIGAFERWRKRKANETFTAHDQLASFRLLYERGELSQQEFERIKKQLLVKLKTGNPAAVAPTTEPKESPPPETPPQSGEPGPPATGPDQPGT